MLAWRLGLVVVLLVGLAMAALTLWALLVLWHHPVQHAAWRVGLSTVAVSGVWWLLNGPVEGPTLVEVSPTHGLTLADVLAVPALLAGGLVLLLAARA